MANGGEIDFRTRKAKCLIGLLALQPDFELNREKLASLLWDPAPEEQARSSLRQALKEIRDILGTEADSVLRADRFTVALLPKTVTVDVLQLKHQLHARVESEEHLLKAVALWRGELFGSQLPNAPVFEAWVQVERSHLRSLLTKSLTDRLEALIEAGSFSSPNVAEELVRIEPSHELAHQYLMRFYAARGDQAAALRQYTQLERILEDELDSEPSKETNELLVAVKRGDIEIRRATTKAEVEPPTVRPLRDGPPKITIRPPLTRYTDDSKNYLGEGFAYLAKVCLSRFRCWIVVPWPSKGYESDTAIDYAAIGRATDADFAVDCVLDWRSPVGKLFVSLIDCTDSSQIWSNIYSITEHDLQELSSTVAGAVTANLASQVNYISLLRNARNARSSPAAYDLWLKGHQLSRQWDAQSDEDAAALFSRAIELDPGLACGHASLAAIYNTRAMVRPGNKTRKQDQALAFKHAQDAIALDPFDSNCHISMAWSWLIAASGERAYSHFKLAVELNPYDTETLIAAAMGMAFMGHRDEASRWSSLAIQLNPVHPEYFLGYLAGVHYLAGEFAETIAAVQRCPDIFPDLMVWAAAAHAQLGQRNEAAGAYSKFYKLTASRWEGEEPLLQGEIERWLVDVMPIVWPEGRKNFERGINLARQMAEAEQPQAVIGNGA